MLAFCVALTKSAACFTEALKRNDYNSYVLPGSAVELRFTGYWGPGGDAL
jgi:hypothetical protein